MLQKWTRLNREGAIQGFSSRNAIAAGEYPPAPPDFPCYSEAVAICHLRTSVGSASRGQSAVAKHDYITREGKYGRDAGEVEHVEHGNMPSWAAEDGRGYWQAADAGERTNGRLFVEVQIALPNELDSSQQCEVARAFARQLTQEERLPYTVAVHRGESKDPSKPDNPHAHIVMSERSNDGVARTGETWFRRANRQQPESGGARKVSGLQAREWPERIRQGWSKECNRALERAGREERIDPRTLAEQARAALKKGDLDQAAELARTPEPKRGAGDAIQRRYERGKAPEPSRAVAAWKRVRSANGKWRKECRQRSQKASRAREELAGAERVRPVRRKDEGSRPRKVEARRKQRSQPPRAPRKSRPTNVDKRWSSGRRHGPTPWDRYQQRWPEHAAKDHKAFETIHPDRDQWRERLIDQYMRQKGWMQGDGTPAREATKVLALPRALAAEGKHERGAAKSEPDYVYALPERYRQKWKRSGIGERVQEVTKQTRTSLKARLSFSPEKHVEDAVRKECGGEAQRLDREMREEMERDRPLCDVLIRMDTLQYEESRAANERVAGDYLERGRSGVSRSEPGPELEQASSLPAIAQPILAGSQGRSSGGAGGRDWRPDDDEEEEKKKKRQPISMDR